MSNILALTTKEREQLNKALKSYGLRIGGGSIDYDEDRAYVGIDHNGATFNEVECASVLGKKLGANTVILNGREYPVSD